MYRFENNDAYIYGIRIVMPLAILVFVAAMITDFFDGYIARKRNIVTSFGKLWDPIADKFITTTALIFLAAWNMIPVWLVLLFVLRDLVVDGCRSVLSKHSVDIAANIFGKIKTMLLSIGLVITLIVFTVYAPYNASYSSFYSTVNAYWFTYVINLPILIAGAFNIIAAIPYIKNALLVIKQRG
ncbi:CDP-diacylglycerol--glycerol-3-phosphate 3-phosphatidyltransferase [Mycoplasmopsis alligatoris A21JP2]|uniref:CDP-diacylglycerol--glycerol-3-phosphate 3-phosphatidyltransferase n=2 Tax=Mycoplasmopsis alligatoris TaxID=47687 RepID=D4XVX7_9BACT|nr:CDP-diacylglycerol--glycerol-3-phosphate 3-phosphatidyltransferase [Mycoplasmopsis alligatoris A21JP2]